VATVYKRRRTYWIRFQWQGQTIRKSAHTTVKADALAYLVKLRDEHIRVHRDGRPRRTFPEMVERYEVEHMATLKPTTARGYRAIIRLLYPHFQPLYLDEINKTRITEYVGARRRAGASSPTIRRNLACLSSMLSCTVASDWLDVNPVRAYDKRSVRENPPRVRHLTEAEYHRLIDAASPYMRPMIALAAHTGMRVGELLSLEWSQVNLRRREITLVKTKTNAPRVIPLSDAAVTVFVTIPRHPVSRFVFAKPDTGERYGSIVIGFRGACRRAGIENFRFHDLRHSFATWAVQSGMDLYRLSRILGHATLEMTTRYAHLATADLHDALRRVGTFPGTRAEDSPPISAE
jgi:integrase/recombinase XerD